MTNKIKLTGEICGRRHKMISTRDLRQNLAEALKFTSRQEGKLVLTKNGEERAALVSLRDLEVLDALDDLRIQEALHGRFDKKIFWSVLKDRLLKDKSGEGGRVMKLENARGRRKAGA